MQNFLKRLMFSPRWRWLHPWIRPYVLPGGPTDQWLRIVLNRETMRLVSSLETSTYSALEISGDNWSKQGLFAKYKSIDFPEFDVCAGKLEEKFDLIIAEQVFEHLLWPYRAAKNIYEMLEPGGRFLVTTPFMIRVHNHPVDCSRWTEIGMKHLLAECGFPIEKVITGSWGNRACVKANLERWQIYQPWRHSLKNETDYPLAVWALAQK